MSPAIRKRFMKKMKAQFRVGQRVRVVKTSEAHRALKAAYLDFPEAYLGRTGQIHDATPYKSSGGLSSDGLNGCLQVNFLSRAKELDAERHDVVYIPPSALRPVKSALRKTDKRAAKRKGFK